jgi:hypothetical protein
MKAFALRHLVSFSPRFSVLPCEPGRAHRRRRRCLEGFKDRNGHAEIGVFDLTLPLDRVAEGYRAMDERRAIKTLLRPDSRGRT